MQKIIPHLWFDDKAEEAVGFYISLFDDSRILSVAHYDEVVAKAANRPAGSVMTIEFELSGQKFMALNGGPIFHFTEAVSFLVNCKTQEEIDMYWEKLTADGGEGGVCGWLKDKYGLSWQIVPTALGEIMSASDDAKKERVMKVMLNQKKLNIKELEDA